MKYKVTPIPNTQIVLSVIEDARKAEKSRDLKKLQKNLQSLGFDTTVTPNFAQFDSAIQGELYRLIGVYFTLLASAESKQNFLTAKDYLTKAITIFEHLDLKQKIIESNIWLGYCYGCCGENDNYKAIYDYLELQYEFIIDDSAKMLILINRQLINFYQENFTENVEIYEKSTFILSCCRDNRLKLMFYCNLGISFRRLKNPDKAILFLNEALKYALELKINSFQINIYNNLSLAYADTVKFNEASYYLNKAIEICKSTENQNQLANLYDSKALLLLKQNNYQTALKYCRKSLELLEQSNDFNQIVQNLWTEITCLSNLNQKTQMFSSFFHIYEICKQHIDDSVLQIYLQKFENLFHLKQNLPLEDEVLNYEKELTIEAMIKANGKIGEASKLLGLDNYQTLQYSLKFKFPELKNELGLKSSDSDQQELKFEDRSKIVKASIRKQPKPKIIQMKPDQVLLETIKPVDLPSKIYSFDFDKPPVNTETFIASADKLTQFGINEMSIIAVSSLDQISAGKSVLLEDDGNRIVGIVQWDNFAHLYFIFDANQQPLPITAENVIGEVLAYCPWKYAKGEIVEFRKI